MAGRGVAGKLLGNVNQVGSLLTYAFMVMQLLDMLRGSGKQEAPQSSTGDDQTLMALQQAMAQQQAGQQMQGMPNPAFGGGMGGYGGSGGVSGMLDPNVWNQGF